MSRGDPHLSEQTETPLVRKRECAFDELHVSIVKKIIF